MLLFQGGEARSDALVQLADRVIVVREWHQTALDHSAVISGLADDRAIAFRGIAGPLQIDEVIQHVGVEGRQSDRDVGRKDSGVDGKIVSTVVGRRTERNQQIVHEREMQHLIDRNIDHGCAPAAHRRELGFGKAFVSPLLERKRTVEIRAHQTVLDLRSLAQHGNELVAM